MAKITSTTLYNGDMNDLQKTISALEDKIIDDCDFELHIDEYKNWEVLDGLNKKYLAEMSRKKLEEKQKQEKSKKRRLNRDNYLTRSKSSKNRR